MRVNDRGPYERNRIIDLSSKTAELLEVKRHGSVKVKVEYIGPAKMEGHDKKMLLATYVAPDNTEIGNPRVMVAMNQVKKASATAIALRSVPKKPTAPTVMVAARQPQPAPSVAVAMRAPAASPQIVLAMAPIPRARPNAAIAAGTPIDPYNYEIMAAQNDVPLAAPVATQPAAVAAVEPEIVAAPTVVRASAAGDGSDYGPRTLGSFTVDDPTAFTQPEYGFDQPDYSKARSSYAAGPELTDAQHAVNAMAKGSRAGLKRELEEAVARLAAERRAEATEIAVGVFASDANAAAMAEKIAWLGRATSAEVEIGGRSMHEVRVLVTKRGVSDGEAVAAVAAAGARGAYIVTR